jgi:MFS family permease
VSRAFSDEESAPRGLLALLARIFSSFRAAPFRRYASGAQLAYTGSWMIQLSQSLLILDLGGGSGALLGVTVAIQSLPLLIFGPWAGVLADRFGPVRMLMTGELILFTIAGLQALVVLTGFVTIASVLTLAALFGVGMVMEQTMRSAVVVDLVPADQIANAVSLNALFLQLGRFLGPAIGGVLVASTGFALPFATGAALFAGFAIVLSTLSSRRSSRPATLRGGLRPAVASIVRDPVLPEVLILAAVGGIVGPNFVTFATLVITEELGGGAQTVGLAGMLLAVGTITGALLAAWRNTTSVVMVRLGAVGVGVSALLALLGWTLPVYMGTLVLAGFAAMMLVTQSGSTVQSRAEGELRGRISAIFSIFLLVGIPVGAPLFGVLADSLGPRPASAVLGGFVVLSVVTTTLVAARRGLR